jgi:hypothetical protein
MWRRPSVADVGWEGSLVFHVGHPGAPGQARAQAISLCHTKRYCFAAQSASRAAASCSVSILLQKQKRIWPYPRLAGL